MRVHWDWRTVEPVGKRDQRLRAGVRDREVNHEEVDELPLRRSRAMQRPAINEAGILGWADSLMLWAWGRGGWDAATERRALGARYRRTRARVPMFGRPSRRLG